MDELSCQRCRERTPEFALGVLEGRERCEMVGHLQRCTRCQYRVADLATTGAHLLELLPETDPSPGFADRVLAALPAPAMRPSLPEPRTSRFRVSVAAAVVAAALLAVTGGYVLLHPGAQGRAEASRTEAVQPTVDLMAAPLIAQRRQIGTAYISPSNPAVVFVAISEEDSPPVAPRPDASSDATVTCELVRRDGSTIQLGSFPLHHGHAAWVARTSVDPHTLRGATLTARHGQTLGSAHFTPTEPSSGSASSDHSRGNSDSDQPRTEHSQSKSRHDNDRHSKDSDGKGSDSKDSPNNKDTNSKSINSKDSSTGDRKTDR